MLSFLKRFWNEEDGFTVVEILIVIAVLITIALIFRTAIMGYAKQLISDIFGDPQDTNPSTTAQNNQPSTYGVGNN